ncbi:squalene/phytoene synthase family protein [Streptomyces roseoverticillatus]|uniref:phytoene/squalene synthase family protein n=1 Tax=Streptomyces roseoverticillatus TaxID=66429 RepID=UPI001F415D3E|nr:squalene/phytoene synthase family protein [Streptomyces roseoverticillatus]MCF3106116.1 squalene/phytoene synthase family protein [Streptomyces roseoverticillatus]
MKTWGRTLTAAGIHGPRLRDDYTRQRSLVAAYRRHAYAAVRLLLPAEVVPHVIAATAFMHHTDTLLDQGAGGDAGGEDVAAWEKEVADALASGESGHPVLRPLLHTVSVHPGLKGRIEEFLAGASLDRDFTGFADEAEYQRYVDAYAFPAFMLIAGLVLAPDAGSGPADDAGSGPGSGVAGSRALCRSYIDGSQRLDFVNDLAEDLRDGRLALPAEALERHGVSRADLERGRDTPGTRALLAVSLDRARRDLLASRRLPGFAPPAHRAFIRAFISLEVLTADAALAKGTAVFGGPARPSVPAALGVLLREYGRRGR